MGRVLEAFELVFLEVQSRTCAGKLTESHTCFGRVGGRPSPNAGLHEQRNDLYQVSVLQY